MSHSRNDIFNFHNEKVQLLLFFLKRKKECNTVKARSYIHVFSAPSDKEQHMDPCPAYTHFYSHSLCSKAFSQQLRDLKNMRTLEPVYPHVMHMISYDNKNGHPSSYDVLIREQ